MTANFPLGPARLAKMVLFAALCAGGNPGAWAQSRGELLYRNHCVSCHTAQVHWRDKKRVVDWPSLRAQVRHWQAVDHLAWSDADIEEVAQYLDTVLYRLPLPPPRVVASILPASTRP